MPILNLIDSIDFLYYKIIESFGMLFAPVVSDMKGNIEKIRKEHEKHIEHSNFLEDMMLDENGNGIWNIVSESLLWLNR